jgi:hypothetical protein
MNPSFLKHKALLLKLKLFGIGGLLLFLCGCLPFVDQPTVRPTGYTTAAPNQVVRTSKAIEDASRDLANQLVTDVSGEKKLRLAIVQISDKSRQAGTFAEALQESLRHELFRTKRFDIVTATSAGSGKVLPDTDIDKLLNELRFQEQGTDILKKDTTLSLDQSDLVAAEAMVIGQITDNGSDFRIFCRLVPFKGGLMAGSATATIPKSLFSSRRSGAGASYLGTIYVGADWFETKLDSVKSIDGTFLQFDFTFINRGNEVAGVSLNANPRDTYISDEFGYTGEYVSDTISSRGGQLQIRPDTRASASVTFQAPRQPARYATLNIQWFGYGNGFDRAKLFRVASIPLANLTE